MRGASKLYTLAKEKKRHRLDVEQLKKVVDDLDHRISSHHARTGQTLREVVIDEPILNEIISDMVKVQEDIDVLTEVYSKNITPLYDAPKWREKLQYLINSVQFIRVRLEQHGLSTNVMEFLNVVISKVDTLSQQFHENKIILESLDSKTSEHANILLNLGKYLHKTIHERETSMNVQKDSVCRGGDESLSVEAKENESLDLLSRRTTGCRTSRIWNYKIWRNI